MPFISRIFSGSTVPAGQQSFAMKSANSAISFSLALGNRRLDAIFALCALAIASHIVAHEVALDESNVSDLQGFDFVFICIDDGAAKAPIVEFLEERGLTFIDVGIGVELQDGMLGGVVRATTSTPGKREHLRKRVSMAPPAVDDAYRTNIQIAELNALNACLAVIRWKKLLGFYRDLEGERSTTYTIDGNMLLSEDQECD